MCDTLDLPQYTEEEVCFITKQLQPDTLLLTMMEIYVYLLDLRTYLSCKEELDKNLFSPLVQRQFQEEWLFILSGSTGTRC